MTKHRPKFRIEDLIHAPISKCMNAPTECGISIRSPITEPINPELKCAERTEEEI